MEEQSSNNGGNRQVGPRRSAPRDKARRNDHREIPERVIAAEKPDGPDIRVPFAVREQDRGCAGIDGQRRDAEHAHRFCFG
jgi:hypothetical protein